MAESNNGAVAVVTGASSGIGLAVAHTLAARNFTVVATMRRVSAAPASLRDAPNVLLHPLDVTSEESCNALAQWLRDDRNVTRLDVVVNNAGVGQSGTIETVPVDIAKDVFEVNVWGVMRVCRALLPVMRERGRGGLVHLVSAGMGLHGMPCNDIYVASKFAVEGMMDALRFSIAPENIKVAISNPGPVESNWFERMEQSESDVKAEKMSLAQRMTIVERDMLKRYRSSKAQTAESCAESIVDVIEREYRKSTTAGRTTVRLWNGTSEAAQKTVELVKADPTGCENPVYRGMWDLSYSLAKAAKEGKSSLSERVD